MPTEKFNIGGKTAKDAAATQAATGSAGKYAGETPPPDTYRGVARFFAIVAKPNKNGDTMLRGGVVINEPADSKKAKYNGYIINFRLNISEQGIPYINQMLDAISGGSKQVRDRFWEKGVITAKMAPGDKDKDRPIISIGGLKVPDKAGFPVVVTSSPNNYKNAKGATVEALQVGAFLLNVSTSGAGESSEDFEETEEGDEDFDLDEDTDDTEVDADDADEDEADEESSDDEDEEDDAEEEDGDDEPSDEEQEAERRAGYVEAAAAMDRAALKTEIKKISPTTKILTRHKDDDLRNTLVELQMGEPPF